MRRIPRTKSALSQRLSYRLDRFLSSHPVVQLGAVLGAATFLAVLFGVLFKVLSEGDHTVDHSVWWSVTHMLDGGTVADDKGFGSRLLGLGVTLVGMVLVAIVTGAFASSFADRLREVRRGTLPVFERGHIVILGYSARTEVLLRELCASALRVTVVVVTRSPRTVVEERARTVLGLMTHRVRFIVRHADPGSAEGVRGASAENARAIVILPDMVSAGGDGASVEVGSAEDLRETPDGPTSVRQLPLSGTPESDPLSHADRSALRGLLAARRSLRGHRIPVLVDLESDAARPLVGLCSQSDEVALMEDGRLGAHLLSHAVRQPGVIDVVRQILSLDARSVYLHPAGEFQGKVFEQAHTELGPGILMGVVRDGRPILCPVGGLHIKTDDQLLVFADDAAEPRRLHKAASGDASTPRPFEGDSLAFSLLVTGFRSRVGPVLSGMRQHGVSAITWLVPPGDKARAKEQIAASAAPLNMFTLVEGNLMDSGALDQLLKLPPNRILMLASEHPHTDPAEADSDQLLTLLYLRRAMSRANVVVSARSGRPVDSTEVPAVVEVHTASSAHLLPPRDDTEMVLLREISGLFLAQQIHALCLHDRADATFGKLLRQILIEMTTRLWLRPLNRYVQGVTSPHWEDVRLGARTFGEIAIGVKRKGAAADLLPQSGERIDPRDAFAVVLGADAQQETG